MCGLTTGIFGKVGEQMKANKTKQAETETETAAPKRTEAEQQALDREEYQKKTMLAGEASSPHKKSFLGIGI